MQKWGRWPAWARIGQDGDSSVAAAIVYLARDDFMTDRAAGAIDGTAAEPGPGTRTVTDASSKITISADMLRVATGAADGSGLWLPALTRSPGLLCVFSINIQSDVVYIGFDSDQSGAVVAAIAFFGGDLYSIAEAIPFTVGAYANATDYKFTVVLRANGAYLFVKGGAFAQQTLLRAADANSGSPVYPGISVDTTGALTIDAMHVPAALWLPEPLASDGFASAFGSTDGLGHAEGVVGGLGSGGAGVAWTQRAGTWTVAGGKASAATLAGGIAIATVPTTTADVIVEVKLTRSAGLGGVVLRYADGNNYLYFSHDGTNLALKQVLAGVTTTLVTLAIVFAGGEALRCDLSGTDARIYYLGQFRGSTASINAALTGTAHGLYVTSTTANLTLDDFVVMARGSGGEYAVLDTY